MGPVFTWFCLVCLLCTASVMLSLLVAPRCSHPVSHLPALAAEALVLVRELPWPPRWNSSGAAHPSASPTCRGGGGRGCISAWEHAALGAERTPGFGDGEY